MVKRVVGRAGGECCGKRVVVMGKEGLRQVRMAHNIHLEGSFLLEFYNFNGNMNKMKGLLFS